mgnify:CR=1 FL=1
MKQYLVVGFLPGYATNKKRGYDIASVPGDQLTHLIYCFAGFVQSGAAWQAATPEPKDATKNFPKLLALKQRYPALKLMVSVGGWNNSQKKVNGATIFSTIAADPGLRKAFVQSCLEQFILRSPTIFEGIDIDWEFPGPQDQANFTLLIREFRSQLDAAGGQQGRHYALTLSINTTPANIDLVNLQTSLDWLNVMAYNFHAPNQSPSNAVTNFNAPLYSSPHDPTPGVNIDARLQALIRLGVASRKLVLGIPAYALAYAGVGATNGGLYQPYSGPGPDTYTPGSGILTYKDVMDNYLPTCGSPSFDTSTRSSSIYCVASYVWISPNLADDVLAKATYVMQNNLGGLMLWELGADTIDQSGLAGYMSAALYKSIVIEGLINKVILGETSSASPALASLDGRLFLAWKGSGNDNLNIIFSSNNGASFGGVYIAGETSDAPPALVAHNGKLFLAWKGSGNDNLSVARVSFFANNQGGFGIEGLINKIILGETSSNSPTLASLDGKLFLAWRGSGNDNLSILFSSDNGASFGGIYISGETSDASPALVAHNGKLFLAWKGSGNDNLSVAQVSFFANNQGGFGIAGLTNKIILGETGSNSPTLASLDGRLFLAWKGSGNDNLSIMFSTDNGASFGGKYIAGETSDASPALVTHNGKLFLAWKGSGNDNLSVARVSLFGSP